jgi:hypothetical protein
VFVETVEAADGSDGVEVHPGAIATLFPESCNSCLEKVVEYPSS